MSYRIEGKKTENLPSHADNHEVGINDHILVKIYMKSIAKPFPLNGLSLRDF